MTIEFNIITIDHLRQCLTDMMERGDMPKFDAVISESSRIDELGLDSLNLAELAMRVEDSIGMPLMWDFETEIEVLKDVIRAATIDENEQ
jgi:acyl carrier protein